ncbi:MAG: diguanylate cyclase [Clostridia bacterium]
MIYLGGGWHIKRIITKRLILVIVASMVLIALISSYFQIKAAQETAATNSLLRIGQIRQILRNNDEEITKLKENLREDYFIRAKAAAYIVQANPEMAKDLGALRKIAELLQVDELHLYDKAGRLYSGTEPKHYNCTFHSGEQMEFFLPMLDDYDLQLCQDIMPNTAEQKLMQYTAVWRQDLRGIVQIGMEPVRLLEAMKKNELSHIFTLVTTDKDNTLFAADSQTGVILGATSSEMIGQNVRDYGLDLGFATGTGTPQDWDIFVDDMKSHCMTDVAGNYLIGVSLPYQTIYHGILSNIALIVCSLAILATAVIVLIIRMLDKYIIRGMYQINRDLEKIGAGDLDFRLAVSDVPEFQILSDNINRMVESLLQSTSKLSLVFQNVNIPIAVYEYNEDMHRVLATSKIGKILGITEAEMRGILNDPSAFKHRLEQLCREAVRQDGDIYRLGEQGERYVRVRSYEESRKTFGILVDVTDEVLEKQQIRYERDVDLLTELRSRRAFFSEMDDLFSDAGALGIKAMLMMDVDDLKQMNDGWGHECGDKLLENTARILARFQAPYKLTARLSGDEFVMFVYRLASQDVLKQYLEQMHIDMQSTRIVASDGSSLPVSFSCGYVMFDDEEDYRAVLKLADETMYQAKKHHKGEYILYEPERP